ncbi:hypothetical protein MMC13_007075 [Lambiella insularis]|nr:hypothetical protein [Lambiella insularis]
MADPHEAELVADLTFPFEHATEYASTNLTLAQDLWEGINLDAGMVALPDEWTDSVNLPRAQAFPWDHDKGLYILNSFHVLHCLKSIHRSIREYERKQPQTLPLSHITHCLDNLRSDTLCQADDTPRYTSISFVPGSAIGQKRLCRDWNKLLEFARDHNACYRYISAEADTWDQFERFKFCPKGSPYWPKVEEHFGKGGDWEPEYETERVDEEVAESGSVVGS